MENNNDSSTSSCFKLLQPDLMTFEELCEILRACCVKNDLTSYNKSELVELFKRVALPLPQREYSGNSWREKLLVKNQKRKTSDCLERNSKRVCTSNGSTKATLMSPVNSSIAKSSKSSSKVPPDTSHSSRLKPPINLNNYTKKVLKLALPNSQNSDDDRSSSKIIINEKKVKKSKEQTETSCSNTSSISNIDKKKQTSQENVGKSASSAANEKQTLTNGKHKRIVIDFSDSTTTTTKTPKLVNLKRSTSDKEDPSSRHKIRKTSNI